MIIKKIILTFIFIGISNLYPLGLFGETYFVNGVEGDDLNNGLSAESAWKTLQQSADSMKAGDKAIVLRGFYNERVIVSQSGQPQKPIVFQSCGQVQCKGFVLKGNYVKIVGFEIVNIIDEESWSYEARHNGSGIHIEGNFIEILENHILGATCVGINFYSHSRQLNSPKHCIVRNNSITNSGLAGMYVVGSTHLIDGNDISRTRLYAGDADGIRFFGDGHVFRNNFIHNILVEDGNAEAHIDCFQTYEHAKSMLFEKNTMINLNPGHQGVIIQKYDGLVENFVFKNNLFVMAPTKGYSPAILVGTSGENVRNINFFNNTFVRKFVQGGFAIWLKNCSEIKIENNNFYNFGNENVSYVQVDEIATDIRIKNNSVFTIGEPPKNGPYPNDLWMLDPQFQNVEMNDFSLTKDSPLIDKGKNIEEVADDFFRVPRPQGARMDIGAFEFSLQ
jgi:hypothetical protein